MEYLVRRVLLQSQSAPLNWALSGALPGDRSNLQYYIQLKACTLDRYVFASQSNSICRPLVNHSVGGINLFHSVMVAHLPRQLSTLLKSCSSSDMTPSPLLKSSFIKPVVIVTCFLVLCSNELGVVQCAGAPAYPPGESPAFTPVPTPAPNSSWQDPGCGLWPVKYQAYEQTAMVALLRAWDKSNPYISPNNITNWKETVHPCDRTTEDSGWRGVRCRGLLVNHNDTNGTVCEMFLVGLDGEDFGIIGELVPEIGDLINLEFIYINNNPGQTGPIPESIWNLPYLREVQFINNSLSGAVTLINNMENSALERVDLSHNFLTGFWMTYSSWPALKYLNLSNNLISAPFPDWNNFSQFSELSILYLDKNNITGELDISTFFKSNISESLTELSLKDNNITIVVYTDDYAKEAQTKFLLQGNPFCNNVWFSEADATRCSVYCEQICNYEKSNKWKVIVAATSSSSALVLMFLMLCFAIILSRNHKYIRTLQKKIKKADINAKRFEYNELRLATKNFAPEMKLGAGAYGAVYKGILPNNVVVAVKQLFLETNEGRDDFLNEVLLISNLQHRNLVNLKGYSVRGKQTLLVYEYVDNYDLDKLLFRRHNSLNKQVLNWQARMKVCEGVAQGLYYLHASSQFRIIHRDIKASNILLDKNLQPKIADFGLARPIEDARSVIVTQQCAGTIGYLAPEYMCHGQLSEKADIFSFGVLLLEIVSGKRNRDLTMPEDEIYLPTRAWKLHKENRLLDIKDTTLVVSEDEAREVQQVLETAVLCVQNTPEKRPSMFQVAAMLAGDANVDVSPVDEEYDSWPKRVTMDESDSCENRSMLSPASASAASSRGGPLTNCNATLELSTSLTRS